MGLKGGRKIVVGDRTFRWKFKANKSGKPRYMGDSPRTAHVAVQEDSERPGRPLVAWLTLIRPGDWDEEGYFDNKFRFTPGDVRKLIDLGLESGWDPSGKTQYNVPEGIELTDYKTYEKGKR